MFRIEAYDKDGNKVHSEIVDNIRKLSIILNTGFWEEDIGYLSKLHRNDISTILINKENINNTE
jgi:hypothetical protein